MRPRAFTREVVWPVPRRALRPFTAVAAIACVVLVAGELLAQKIVICFDDAPSRREIAERFVDTTAHRAAQWTAALGCPRSFVELGVDEIDPWGNTYLLGCEPTGTIAVISRGEDGTLWTADDVRSEISSLSRTP